MRWLMTVPPHETPSSDFVTPDDPPPPTLHSSQAAAGKMTAASAIHVAVEQFRLLTGREPDGVTGVRKTPEKNWSVLVDVVELERIPATTSVMATYRVDVDNDGELLSCERLRRFTRGTTDI
jgi:hypothetical protein